LKGVITTAESGWFAFLKTTDIYDSDRVAADGELVRKFYRTNGFPDARVTSAASFEPDLNGIIVHFIVDEGERYSIGAVQVESHLATVNGPAASGCEDSGGRGVQCQCRRGGRP
jgi:outer membrane protein insertion porin family